MSYPRRDSPQLAVKAPLDTMPTTGEDMAPTGEHMPKDIMELSGSDLEVDAELIESSDGPTLAATPSRKRSTQPIPGPRAPAGHSGAAGIPYEPPRRPSSQDYSPVKIPTPVMHMPNPLFPDEAGIDPLAQTMPPEEAHTDQLQEAEAANFAPEVDPMGSDEGLEPLDDAPTRIERQEEIRASHGAAPQSTGPQLLIIGGNNRGREYPLKHGDNSIGRGVDNDVILADIAVSRKHTLICFEGNDFVLRDLGSGNGTLVNGKRVDAHPLRDGDQLELGNTLMRFVHPLAAAPMAPAAIANMATVVTQQKQVELDPVRSTADIKPGGAPAVMTRRERRGVGLLHSRQRKLLVFGSIGLVVLLGGLIGLKAMMARKKQQAAAQKPVGPPPDELAALEYKKGISQYNIRNWEQARVHFLKVVKLVPAADHAKRYLEQSTSEISSRDAMDRASNSLKARDFTTALKELARIPSTSAYAGEALTLKQKVDDEQLSRLLEAARALKEGGDTEGARAKLKEATALAPTNADVLKLSTELSDDKPSRPSVRPPRHHPRPVQPTHPGQTPIRIRGGKLKNVLSLYKQQHWAQAHKEAKSHADSQRGRSKGRADALAKAIYKVGMAWNRAKKTSSEAAKLKYYEEALRHDRGIQRGVHQATLKKLVIQSAKAVAAKAIAKRDYARAAGAVKAAERHGARDPIFAKAKKALEQQAMGLFTRGYTMRTTNMAQARKLWQQVLRMVPPSSEAYQKAYKWLNNSSPSYTDEDED